MISLKQNIGWVTLICSILIGAITLYYTPRTVSPPAPEEGNTTTEPNLPSASLQDPVRFRTSAREYVPDTQNHPFRPTRRWHSVPPETPSRPPLPPLDLPKSSFFLPLPPPAGGDWSPLINDLAGTEADLPIDTTRLQNLAGSITQSTNSDPSIASFQKKYEPHDRIYLKEEDRWLKGTIVDRSDYFLTFRVLSTGKSRSFSLNDLKVKPAKTPLDELRKKIDEQGTISNRQTLQALVQQATEIGRPEVGADLIRSYLENQLPSTSLYRQAARLYRHAGAHDRAMEVLRDGISSTDVDAHQLLFHMARVQWDLGLKQRATETLQEAIDQYPLFFRARLQRFMYLHRLGNHQKAGEDVKKLRSETSGQDASSPKRKLYRFAEIYHQWATEDRSKARERVTRLPGPSDVTENFDFAWPVALALRSRMHLEKDEVEQAYSVLIGGLEQIPSSYALWHNLGMLGLALEQPSVSEQSFSTCNQIAPYRLEHRMGRQALSVNRLDGKGVDGTIKTRNNNFVYAYHRARNALMSNGPDPHQETDSSTSGPPGGDSSSPSDRENPEPDSDGTSGSDDPDTSDANSQQSPDTQNPRENQDSAPSGTTYSDPPQTDSPPGGTESKNNEGPAEQMPETEDKDPEQTTEPSTHDLFKQVYTLNSSFQPGATGLAYTFLRNGRSRFARSFLRHQVPDSWRKHDLMAYSYIVEDNRKEALRHLNEQDRMPASSSGTAYTRTIRAYTLLSLKKTQRASAILEQISDVPDHLSSYVSQLKTIVSDTRKRRQLTDTFDTSTNSENGVFGGNWSRHTDNTSIQIDGNPGYVSFSGTFSEPASFPRLSHPTSEKFISARFSGSIPEASGELFVGVGLLNTENDTPSSLLLAGYYPLQPSEGVFARTEGFAPISEWDPLQHPIPAQKQNGEQRRYSLRLLRENTSSDASWYVEVNGHTDRINLDRFAPDNFNQNSSRKVIFFISGPGGRSVDLRLNSFQLIHQFKE